jgi:hypothetical protein
MATMLDSYAERNNDMVFQLPLLSRLTLSSRWMRWSEVLRDSDMTHSRPESRVTSAPCEDDGVACLFDDVNVHLHLIYSSHSLLSSHHRRDIIDYITAVRVVFTIHLIEQQKSPANTRRSTAHTQHPQHHENTRRCSYPASAT